VGGQARPRRGRALDAVFDNLALFGRGVWVTVQLTLLSYLGAMVVGTLLAAMRVSPVPPARAAGLTYVELVRNIPLPVLMVLFYFGMPDIDVKFSAFVTAVVVLSLYTGAFVAEVLRSGINSVAGGQAEAARSIGLTFPQTLGLIVLPQAFRTVVQPLGTLFLALTKNTSIAYTISVVELTGMADRITTATAEPIAVFGAACVAYMILTLPSGYLIGAIERKVAIRR
jgi:glutamate transport system permease protein